MARRVARLVARRVGVGVRGRERGARDGAGGEEARNVFDQERLLALLVRAPFFDLIGKGN